LVFIYLQNALLSPNSLEMKNLKPRSKFERWIYEFGGPKLLSLEIGVAHSAVNHWCNRKATPTLATGEKILKLSKGKLSLTDILEGTIRK
jgi:hypothetical protein